EMESRIAADLGISPGAVSVKATTTEGMNDEGKGLCISAQAIASVAHR
ncbi:MAG: 2-C-methyl-D-erythritol 2,4-cyclodiphosphate synthase, partial [Clostridia bacterium]|nr:2-C-methyl-D-erythritol 2,4-cyclodiphosphate synthase [Clostridia bacterium]